MCASGNVNGNEVKCEPVEQTCDTTIFNNGTSCATITFEVSGNSATYKGCYYKMKEKEGMLSYNYLDILNVAATYTTCEEDLCNGSENIHNKFNVFVITGVLFVLSKLFRSILWLTS